MSYNTPIPPLVPFSPSGRRPQSQPQVSEVTNDNQMIGNQTDRGGVSGGKQGTVFPPLISALDTYIESSVEAKADSIIFQLNDRRRPNSDFDEARKKKKKKPKASGKSVKSSLLQEAARLTKALTSPTTEDQTFAASVDSLNQTSDILNAGDFSSQSQYSSDNSKDTMNSHQFGNPNSVSPRVILASKYLSSQPIDNHSNSIIDDRIFSYSSARKPNSVQMSSFSAGKAPNNRNIKIPALPEVKSK